MKLIYILPIGQTDPKIIRYLSKQLLGYLHFPTKVLGAIALPASAYDKNRQQYRAGQIIREIRLFDFSNIEKVLGIIGADLYSEDFSFVYGEAEAPGRNALFSLARLDPQYYDQPANQELVKKRALKEATHELGHTYSLSHCPDTHCVMYYAQSIEDVDNKEEKFCARCQKLYEMYNS
ncbi:archaemetzincin family Zn-dependent metalloprotease [Patescibacteria group bacterium]|nr:archaemetzincin family Zn-dependent metalloprotease [Patescibacteria group bacterium]